MIFIQPCSTFKNSFLVLSFQSHFMSFLNILIDQILICFLNTPQILGKNVHLLIFFVSVGLNRVESVGEYNKYLIIIKLYNKYLKK